jgi:tetratricopeptide (TPR) repeat protein
MKSTKTHRRSYRNGTVCISILILLLLPSLSCQADQFDERLGPLFIDLQESTDPAVAKRAEREIWTIWHESPDTKGLEIMREARLQIDKNDYEAATKLLDRLVEHTPNFAEAWNQRAIVLFLAQDYTGCLRDIEQTLLLEPRHFGALSGRAQVYLHLQEPQLALRSFQKALERNPWMAGIREQMAMLRAYLESKQKPI